jgi:hypothetical protein
MVSRDRVALCAGAMRKAASSAARLALVASATASALTTAIYTEVGGEDQAAFAASFWERD